MSSNLKPAHVKPRIIIHGGAGNITRENLSDAAYEVYREALLTIIGEGQAHLQEPGAHCLDVATHVVTLLENNVLFNAAHGAVFTRAGTHELEASVMVSRGYRKRGVGVMKVTRAKNPILLAKEMLVRGQADDGGGAGLHCQLSGETCDELAKRWNLEIVKPSYFWTRKRWDEHRRGLGLSHSDEEYEQNRREADVPTDGAAGNTGGEVGNSWQDDHIWTDDPSWNGKEYLPQGTVGCVVLDSTGTLCVATSTGGLTNKLPGRIGDTPTLGAGFWAEDWEIADVEPAKIPSTPPSNLSTLVMHASDCLPGLSGYLAIPSPPAYDTEPKITYTRRAVAMSGTGNGDSFLRVNAVRTAAAIARFSPSSASSHSNGTLSLQHAVSAVAGPNGLLQKSAEDRWKKTGEGEGGIIGAVFEEREGAGRVVADFNCGGMFRAWVDDRGQKRMAIFREEL